MCGFSGSFTQGFRNLSYCQRFSSRTTNPPVSCGSCSEQFCHISATAAEHMHTASCLQQLVLLRKARFLADWITSELPLSRSLERFFYYIFQRQKIRMHTPLEERGRKWC